MPIPSDLSVRPWQAVHDSRLLVGVLLLATACRFFGIDQAGLWGTELAHARQVADTGLVALLTESVYRDISPPGYSLILYVVTQWLGHSEFALRCLSALAGVGSVCLVALLGRRCQWPLAGLLAATCLAANPMAITASQEVRPESLTGFVVLLQAYLFLGVLSRALSPGLAAPAGPSRAGELATPLTTPREFWFVTLWMLSLCYSGLAVLLVQAALCLYWARIRGVTGAISVFRPDSRLALAVGLLAAPMLWIHLQKLGPLIAPQGTEAISKELQVLLPSLFSQLAWLQIACIALLLLLPLLLGWQTWRGAALPSTRLTLMLLVLVASTAVLLVPGCLLLPFASIRFLLEVLQPFLLLLAAIALALLWHLLVPLPAWLARAVWLGMMGTLVLVQVQANHSSGVFRPERKPDVRPLFKPLLQDLAFLNGQRTVLVSNPDLAYYLHRYRLVSPDVSAFDQGDPAELAQVQAYLQRTDFYFMDLADARGMEQGSPLLQTLAAQYGALCLSHEKAGRLVKFSATAPVRSLDLLPRCADQVQVVPDSQVFPR